MNIRWKIVQNRTWRGVGPSWGLLGCLIGVLERLGSILGASWERLGASWGRPGGIPEPEGDPTWTPGRAQNRPKIDPKSHWFFDRFLDAILIPKWSQNGFPNLPKTVQKSVSFFDRFFIDFWIDLGGRNPWKWAPRVHEKLIFIKSPFPILTYFWKQKWWKRRLHKWIQNGLKNQSKNQRSFWLILYLFLDGFGTILGVKIPSKIE